MANENWNPNLNQPVPNVPVKTYPWLTTITPENPRGYNQLFPQAPTAETGKNLQYAVETTGVVSWRVVDDQGNVRRQFNSLQQLADSGYNFGFPITKTIITQIKNKLSTELKSYDEKLKSGEAQPSPFFTGQIPGRPVQPAPQAAGAQGGTDPGSQAATVGAGISTYNLDNFEPLDNVLDKFEKTSFDKIKQYLFYPENIGKSGQDRITITQIEYVPGKLDGALTGSLSNRESDFNTTAEKALGTVVLPIPNELSEANATGWGEDSLSSITAALMGAALPAVSNIASGKAQAALGDLDEIKKALKSDAVSTRLTQFLTVNAAASVLKFAGIQVNPEAYITRATGAAVNPNLELLFQGPKLRQFGFTFKMAPRSEAEARNIRSILKFFKKGMAPRRSKEAATTIFLGTPNVFRIAFKSGGGELTSIGKIKTCALVSFNVNYTPDGFYAAFQDSSAGGSQPVAVVMQMGFTELTPIFNDDYDGDIAGVGPENIFKNFDVVPAAPKPGDSNFIGPPGPDPVARRRALEEPPDVIQRGMNNPFGMG
jgi:hypothetical protein